MRVLDFLTHRIAKLLHDDTARVLLGEDVADGGMLGLSRVCLETPELTSRLLSTPLVPAVSIAHAAGLAATGLKPMLLLPSATSLIEGYAALREAVQLHRQAPSPSPFVILAPWGPGLGFEASQADAPTALLCCIPGLRVVCLGQAAQAVALLTEAANFTAGEQPTVVLLPRSLLLQEAEQVALSSPFAHAEILNSGSQATVFAWGAAVEYAAQAITTYYGEADPQAIGLVDVRTLAPLDIPTLVQAAQQTGKLVIVYESSSAQGTGAELAAIFAEHAIFQLDAPILRVMCNQPRQELYSDDVMRSTIEQIGLAIRQVITY